MEAGAAQLPGPDAQQRATGAVAEALLALPESDAELAWKQLPREALLAEVFKYRDSIRDVATRLRVHGGASLQPALYDHEGPLLLLQGGGGGSAAAAATAAAGIAAFAVGGTATAVAASVPDAADLDPEDADLQQLGDEGLDYTLGNVDDVDPSEWQVPPHCVPIHANVTTFDWPSLYEHCQFDVVMMDPPWQLATANPTRGVALGYSQLNDDHISNLPVPQLQRNGGFLFVWVINAKYKWTLDLFDKWGYRLVDEVVWVKMTVNRRLAKSHGYYLQHAKEVCLVAKCGDPPGLAGAGGGVGSDIIFSERRGQSQKPEEIYELIEQLVPNGRYLEIFARKNNLRDYWVSIGNEVTGTGLPEEDMRALKELNCIPGAVYGKTGGGGGAGGGSSRAASGGSGVAAAAADAGGPGVAGPSGRGASSGGAGAGAGPARGARAASPATRGPSPAPAVSAAAGSAAASGRAAAQKAPWQVQGSSGGGVGGGGAELPPRPPEGAGAAASAAPAGAATPQAAQAQHQHQQHQPGATRLNSRLSLSNRRHSAAAPPPPMPPLLCSEPAQHPHEEQRLEEAQMQPQALLPEPAGLAPRQREGGGGGGGTAQAGGGGGGAAGPGDAAAVAMETDPGPQAEPHEASQPMGLSPLGLNGGFGGSCGLGPLGFEESLGPEFGGGDMGIGMGFVEGDDVDWA